MAGSQPEPSARQVRPSSARPQPRRILREGISNLRETRRQMHLPANLLGLRNRIGRSTMAVEGLSPEAALYARHNFRFGVLNGILFTLVDALISPTLVLALFVNRLGGSNLLVGLLPAILLGGWFLPQLVVASKVQGKPLVMGWYRRAGLARIASLVLLMLSTVAFADQPAVLLASFFLFYSLYSIAGGVTGIPWFEIVSKVIPPRRRGTFFGLRSFWGGLVALLSSGLIAAILSEKLSGLKFPYNFALLFAITTPVVGVAIWAWSSVHEPKAVVASPAVTLRELLHRGVRAVKLDKEYRVFMVARILLALATVADPFYVVYAKSDLGAPVALVGLYLGASAASSLLSNFLWSPLADRAGNRLLMNLTVLSVALVPLAALVIPFAGGILPREDVYTLFALVFVFAGLAVGAGRIVNNNMLLAIAQPDERATYIGFLNTVLGLVTFVPVLGGLFVDFLGFVPLFVLTLLIAASAMLASARMSKRTPSMNTTT